MNDGRGRQASIELDEEEHSNIDADPATAVENERDVGRALSRLSLRQRAIFDLHYKKGMTHSEIAEALELPLGTVKSDLVRGHEKLKKWLGGVIANVNALPNARTPSHRFRLGAYRRRRSRPSRC